MHLIYVALIPGLWAAWALYWLAAADNLKPIQRRETSVSRAAHITPLVIAGALFFIPGDLPGNWGGFLFDRFLPLTYLGYWIGVAIVAAGLGFAIWARRRLGGNWSGTVTLKQDHELIRAGPYRFVRHPIYTGLLAAFLGSAIALGEWRGLVATALASIAFLLKIRTEERWMTEAFPGAYAHYRNEVKALIPFVL